MTIQDNDLSRRGFTALTVAAGVAATTGTAKAALPVTSKDVLIKTPDGEAEAVFVHPTTGTHPAVLVWTDIFGLRPYFREFAARIAAEGYAVLVPHPFYRTDKSPVVADATSFDFAKPEDRALTARWTAPINAPGAIERDAATYVTWLDAQKEVDTKKKIGTQGYCMGGPLVFRTAASQSGRVGAGACFHPGGLVTNNPGSPHLLIPQMKGRYYIGIAGPDDAKQPDMKDKLKAGFAAANIQAEVVVYDDFHGWTVKDMPKTNGQPTYNAADAQRAYAALIALYKSALA